MSLDQVVDLTITVESVSPTRLGFGTPLIMAVQTVDADVLAEFASMAELVDAGYPTAHPVYRIASKFFSQNPRPQKVLVGKRSLPFTQTFRLIPVNVTEGYVYNFTFVDADGTETAISYTVLAAATVATIVTALVALLSPLDDCTATDSTTHVTIASTAGKLVNVKDLPNPAHLKVLTVTADPGIATDLGIIFALDGTTWYSVQLDSESEAEVKAAAAYIETIRKQLFYTTSDSDVLDGGVTNDICSDLQDASYARTSGIFSAKELLSYSSAAWAGGMLPTDPGAGTWAYRTLRTVTVDTLTSGQITQAHAKNCSTYTTIGGVNVTLPGKSASGEFIDITHFVDWLFARLQERIFGAIANASASGKKIPYTDQGVDIIRGLILAQLAQGIKAGGLAKDPAPTVTAPAVADIDSADKIARVLPDVSFTATLAGAIHAVQITGTLSV
jgi:hypothetical protein